MGTGANCGNTASQIQFNIIYIMRTKIEEARLRDFDQNSVNHPGILLMAHSAQFFTLDEINPCCRPAPDNADGRAAPGYLRSFEAIRGYLEKQYHIIRWRKDSTDWLREVIMLPLMHTLSNLQSTHKKYI